MHGILGRGQDAEIDDSWTDTLDEDECPEITVASHKEARLFMSHTKQLGIFRLCQTQLSGRHNVMSYAAEKCDSAGVDILVS